MPRESLVKKSVIFFLLVFFIFPQTLVFAIPPSTHRVDLDGDKVLEEISLRTTPDGFALVVNKQQVDIGDADSAFVLRIVDLDVTDQKKEILVSGEGAGGGPMSFLFAYKDQTIITLQEFAATLEIKDNGIVYANFFESWWTKRERYQFDSRTRTLALTPQELYYVGKEVTVKKSFPLYQKRGDAQEFFKLSQGSKVTILAIDASPQTCQGVDGKQTSSRCEWYLIKSATGLLGWARGNQFLDLVDGIIWAG